LRTQEFSMGGGLVVELKITLQIESRNDVTILHAYCLFVLDRVNFCSPRWAGW